MDRSRRALPALLGAVLLFGCASAPSPGKTVLLDDSGDTIVVLPLNVTAPMPERIAPASALVWKEFEVYLGAHDVPVKTLSFPSARNLWLRSVGLARESAGPRAGFDDAARVFADELAKHAEFDTVIVPTLFVQGAQIWGRSARWDGAERPIDVDEGSWRGQIPEDASYAGAIPAASLHVVVLDANGREVQQVQAGLDLLTDIRLLDEPDAFGAPTWEFVDRSAPFANPDHLLEGIARSLAPFLRPLSPEAVRGKAP